MNISYQGTVYFYGSQIITMNTVKTFDFINVTQSNQIVYSPFIGTFTLSSLSVADQIVVSANYNYFYSNNQSNCTNSVVFCGLNGVLSVLQKNNSANGLTTFSIDLMNLDRIAQYNITVATFDSQKIYAKQSSVYTLSTTVPNALKIVATQTNPYLS